MGIYPRETNTNVHIKMRTQIFTTALFIITKKKKKRQAGAWEPEYQEVETNPKTEWMNKYGYSFIVMFLATKGVKYWQML